MIPIQILKGNPIGIFRKGQQLDSFSRTKNISSDGRWKENV
jgi:hypothetical protein